MLAHLTHHLGEVTGEQAAGVRGGPPWSLVRLESPSSPDLVAIATVGLSGLGLAGPPQELVCATYTRWTDAATTLVRMVADQVLQRGESAPPETVLAYDVPVVEGTQLSALFVGDHPYLGDSFTVVSGQAGATALYVGTIVPLTSTETLVWRQAGVDALLAVLGEPERDLYEFGRGIG